MPGGDGPIGPWIEFNLGEVLFTLQAALGHGGPLPDDAAILAALEDARSAIDQLIQWLTRAGERAQQAE